ncbi:hypothetical protein WDU94_009147 [Cyamophila willieti]
MQYLTPPRIQPGHRDGRLQHYNINDDIENIGIHQVTENSQKIQDDTDNQEITIPETGDSVDDRAAQLQSLSHIQLDQTELQYDQNKLKKLSAVEWQCFLMNFIKYLKMSKAGHVVRMSHECDPITLQHFMTSLNTNDQMQTNTEILTNEIENEEKDYTKLSLNSQHFVEDQNEIIKQLVSEQHELVKLAPHLSGEYFVNSDQKNIMDTNKTRGFDENKHFNNTGDTSSNTPKPNETKSSNNFNFNSFINSEYIKTEHYLNNQEIIDNNNIFQDMLEGYTESAIPSEDSYTIGPIPYESESFTKNAATSTITDANNLEISAPNAMFYPKGFSFTNDQQSDFVTEKPILLTAPKKIKIVIPYRKRSSSDLRKEKDSK